MPFENNIILNPQHPHAASIRVVATERITLDERLINRLIGSHNEK